MFFICCLKVTHSKTTYKDYKDKTNSLFYCYMLKAIKLL